MYDPTQDCIVISECQAENNRILARMVLTDEELDKISANTIIIAKASLRINDWSILKKVHK